MSKYHISKTGTHNSAWCSPGTIREPNTMFNPHGVHGDDNFRCCLACLKAWETHRKT